MAESSEWYQDPQQCKEMIDLHGSASAAARAWGIPERRVRYWKMRHQLSNDVEPAPLSEQSSGASSVKISDDEVTLISAANPRGTDLITPEEMLEEVGLNPAEWSFKFERTKYDALAGDGKITTLHRIMVKASKRPEALLGLNIEPGWVPQAPRQSRAADDGRPRLIAFFGDQHYPLEEEELIEASLAWCEEHRPDEIVLLGDVSDNSAFARHTKNPRTFSSVGEQVAASYKGLARLRAAAPDAKITMLVGNHEHHLLLRIRELMPHYEELQRPGEEFALLSLRSVLNLDSLGIELVDSSGEYFDSTYQVLPDLVALHGVKTGRDGAVKEQAGWESTSIIHGHCHHLQITGVTKRLPGGGEQQRYAINVPSMGRRDLGYNAARNGSQGWATVTVHPNGRWVPELATYDSVSRSTTWRDWIY